MQFFSISYWLEQTSITNNQRKIKSDVDELKTKVAFALWISSNCRQYFYCDCEHFASCTNCAIFVENVGKSCLKESKFLIFSVQFSNLDVQWKELLCKCKWNWNVPWLNECLRWTLSLTHIQERQMLIPMHCHPIDSCEIKHLSTDRDVICHCGKQVYWSTLLKTMPADVSWKTDGRITSNVRADIAMKTISFEWYEDLLFELTLAHMQLKWPTVHADALVGLLWTLVDRWHRAKNRAILAIYKSTASGVVKFCKTNDCLIEHK